MLSHAFPWVEPLQMLCACRDEAPLVLLYSGIRAGYSGNRSLLARLPVEDICGDSFRALENRLSATETPFDNAWFGWLGDGLKYDTEQLPPESPHRFSWPMLWMARFAEIWEFDHARQTLICHALNAPDRALHLAAAQAALAPPPSCPAVALLASNMTREDYFERVETLLERIRNGELYQANLTRKFFLSFTQAPDPAGLFLRLMQISPVPYGAYIRHAGGAVLSASPERFLHVDAQGTAVARPIKGTAPRASDTAGKMLAEDEKNRAENLMIVDLMRNDLARSCIPGTVAADKLFDVTAHANLYHMSSTIRAQKQHERPTLELVKGCFPPGSMTGAPKVRAMQACIALEKQARGMYGGAIGWFGGDGSCDLSVVIRTLMLQGQHAEFQVGGGIVADSTAEGEWYETLVKAQALCRAIGVEAERLEAL